MASEVDICNLALARLGDDANITSIDPPEGSVQSEHCARWYPLARDTLLAAFPWSFATQRVQLTLKSGVPQWARYGYALPANTLRVVSVMPAPGGATLPWLPESQDFTLERADDDTLTLYTDQEAAWARVTLRITDDTRFPPLFVDALAWFLASHLAGPILKGDAGIKMTQSCYQMGMAIAARAKQGDAQQGQEPIKYQPAGIRARA